MQGLSWLLYRHDIFCERKKQFILVSRCKRKRDAASGSIPRCSGLIRLNWSTFAWINAIHHYVRRHLVCVPDASLHDRRQTESLCNEFPNNVLIGFRRLQELRSFIDRDRQALHDCADRIDFSSKRPSFRSGISIFSTSLLKVVTPCGRFLLVRTYYASLHDQQ